MSSDAFYNELLPEINQVIDELGAQFVVSTPGQYNVDTLKTDPPTTRQVFGVVADQSMVTAIAGPYQNVSWAGKKTLILKADANPKEGESIVVDGQSYPLNKIVTVKPANVVMVYMLDVSK